MPVNLLISIVLSILLFSGCTLGPDYERPVQKDMPETFRQSAPVQAPADTQPDFALKNWSQVYRDKQLQSLIQAGLANNLDLSSAASRIREARSYLTVSRADLYPDVNVGFEGEREKDSGLTNSSTGPENTFLLGGLVSWEIDLWGKTQRSVEGAEATLASSVEKQEALKVSLIGEISTAYFELLDLKNRIQISKRTVESRKESVRILELRKKGGLISKLELQQARVELAKTQIALPQLFRDKLVKENQLSILIGKVPGKIPVGLKLKEQPLPSEVPVGLPSSLLLRRPDIREVEQQMIAANAAIGVAEANFFPSLTLTGEYGRESNELNDLLKTSGEAWTLGLNALLPIFNAGRNKANLAIAKEQYEQAVLNYRKVILVSLQEVSDALERYSRSAQELAALSHLVASSKEYVRLARQRYNNGVLSYLDLLDAERLLFSSEISESETMKNRLLAFVTLYKSLGGGWEAQPDESS